MSAQSTLTLNTKAYAPRGNISGVASWALVGDTSFGGAVSNVTESVRGPSKDGLYRVQFKLNLPKAADGNSSCACDGDILSYSLVNLEITVPRNFTSAERTDLYTRIKDLVSSTVVSDAVSDLETSW